jgi:hypothetical protein
MNRYKHEIALLTTSKDFLLLPSFQRLSKVILQSTGNELAAVSCENIAYALVSKDKLSHSTVLYILHLIDLGI